MRKTLFALAAMCGAAGGAHAQEVGDIAGHWRAQQINTRLSTPNYFRADLHEHDGRIEGNGVINLCAGCRGWEEYEIDWEGRAVGDHVELSGIPDHPFQEPVRFEGELSEDGQRISGTLTQGRRRSEFIMLRGRNADEGAGAAHESR